jgi:pimeloyl-ACP methyl ester carboxylesterase
VNEHTITSFDGTRIWYADSGGDGPVVVLLHGVCVTSRSNFGVDPAPREHLAPVAARGPSISSTLLNAGARVVAFDMRGHGRSGRSPDPERYRGDTHARDAVAVIDASEANRVDVVGYSMGSYTASRLLDREPRLRSVALCGSSSQFVEGIDQSPYGDDLCSWFRGCAHAFQTNTWDDPLHEGVRQVAVRTRATISRRSPQRCSASIRYPPNA